MDIKKEISILIVEDEDDSRNFCAELLKEEYKKIFTASTLTQAKSIYLQHFPDIIILDITLPDGNGLDFLRKIRKEDIETKVIVLTAHSDLDTVLSATDLKLSKYLIKPLKMSKLTLAINEAIKELQDFKIEKNDIVNLYYGYTWDKKNRLLYKDSKQISLSNKQRDFFQILSKMPNIPVSKEQIIYSIWGEENSENSLDNLKTLVKNIRKKVSHELIISIYGVGYMIKKR